MVCFSFSMVLLFVPFFLSLQKTNLATFGLWILFSIRWTLNGNSSLISIFFLVNVFSILSVLLCLFLNFVENKIISHKSCSEVYVALFQLLRILVECSHCLQDLTVFIHDLVCSGFFKDVHTFFDTFNSLFLFFIVTINK